MPVKKRLPRADRANTMGMGESSRRRILVATKDVPQKITAMRAPARARVGEGA
jgi:hypothetical protein